MGAGLPSVLEVPGETLAERKRRFLRGLASPKGYRRYLGAPLRYPGGKSAAVGYIVELLPDHVERLVSPFLGGGSVEVAVAKELGVRVVAYDIFGILVNFWQVLLDPVQKAKMLEVLRGLKPDRATYEEVKEALRRYWHHTQYGEGEPGFLAQDRILLAAYFYFNYQLSYGPGFLGWPSSLYLRSDAYQRLLAKLETFSAPGLEVHQGDFRQVLPRHRKDFLYLDPPYYLGQGSKVFKGLYPMRNFPIHHEGFPHETLKELLDDHEGRFILSYNDCPAVRSLYAQDVQLFPKWPYSMGLGEKRIGRNRRERGGGDHRKESHEILILRPRRDDA